MRQGNEWFHYLFVCLYLIIWIINNNLNLVVIMLIIYIINAYIN